ncbi:MAG: ATP-binding cassette domain-containing protein [Rothia sp. (in: high G+C Gram-positive bacteria)]|uniref:ABC transporter ATP-binding protein n=1 Tax=Rothia sp. (in: high G+C Gram-positive bacteria) TaxID=1885016 RepID=UPI0026DA9CB4|nr:ATP-binding cassette domain-containing protein [Rothia sp. (in: high G+C Gram-positive bacteria)]MDO4883396.1 ATP-binding cassette domain-containing protein [Rothia sp. (in: high G+C Gram-positive bacteria)]
MTSAHITHSYALSVHDAFKTYPGSASPVLTGVNLTLERGESFVILGATGSGKSTLLRSVAGLETLDSGTVRLAGNLAMVFQQAALLSWLNVRDNVALGGKFRRNRAVVGASEVDRLLDTLGLSELSGRLPAELSGGQAQRVSIARALAVKPSVLLLDEPLSALDPATRADVQRWLREVIDTLNVTALTVSHDISEALLLGDRIGFFEAGKGFTRIWDTRTERVSEEEIFGYYRAHSTFSQAPLTAPRGVLDPEIAGAAL